MNFDILTTTQWEIAIAAVVILSLGIAAMAIARKRRTEKLRAQFGDSEYDRALREVGSQRKAESILKERNDRVQSFQIRPLSVADQARFRESWRSVQGRFVDSPGGAITEADRLLGDVMSLRGYPVADFAQRAADISVDYPSVTENYRAAHAIAIRQTMGQASTEELRQAMIHYRTLFEELVDTSEIARAQSA